MSCYYALADQALKMADDYRELERLEERLQGGDMSAYDDLRKLSERIRLEYP